jgi:hypothetical protein
MLMLGDLEVWVMTAGVFLCSNGNTQAWLDRHGPFDAIVDAANVGLYNQNFGDGGFNYFQVNLCLPYFHACSLLQFKIIEDYEA